MNTDLRQHIQRRPKAPRVPDPLRKLTWRWERAGRAGKPGGPAMADLDGLELAAHTLIHPSTEAPAGVTSRRLQAVETAQAFYANADMSHLLEALVFAGETRGRIAKLLDIEINSVNLFKERMAAIG